MREATTPDLQVFPVDRLHDPLVPMMASGKLEAESTSQEEECVEMLRVVFLHLRTKARQDPPPTRRLSQAALSAEIPPRTHGARRHHDLHYLYRPWLVVVLSKAQVVLSEAQMFPGRCLLRLSLRDDNDIIRSAMLFRLSQRTRPRQRDSARLIIERRC